MSDFPDDSRDFASLRGANLEFAVVVVVVLVVVAVFVAVVVVVVAGSDDELECEPRYRQPPHHKPE